MSRAAHASREHAPEEDLVLDGVNAVQEAGTSHAAPSPAQEASNAQREEQGQDAGSTPAQAPKPRLMTRMERLAAEQIECARQARQAQQDTAVPGQDQNREAAERLAAEQARQAPEQARGYEL